MDTLWSERYSLGARRMQGSAIRELLKLTEQPDFMSFAGGLPAPELFPVDAFKAAMQRVLSEHGTQVLQYSTTEGYLKLREMISRHTARYGIGVSPDNILITNGSQQALDLLGKVFVNAGDRILVERPTYLGALQAWNAYQADYVSVGMDPNGVLPEALEAALHTGPKFIYVLPNFQNPTGVTLSLERRKLLVEMADRFGVPIIEDDPYGQLRFEGDHLPSLSVLDYKARGSTSYTGNVIYLSTFSKTLAPGLRLGWVVAPAEVIRRLTVAKQGTDLHTGLLVQMAAYEVARGGYLDRHIRQIRSVYLQRRDAMLAAMARYFPRQVRWTRPQGGLFLWVTLPPWLDSAGVLKRAFEQKVAFVPGEAFFADNPERNTMRLNFSNADPERIEEGIRRLGAVLNEILAPALAQAL